MRTAAAVERLAGRRVALPQRVVGLAVQPADRPPLLEDLAQPVACGLPLRRVGGQVLGLGGQRLLAGGLRGAVFVAPGPVRLRRLRRRARRWRSAARPARRRRRGRCASAGVSASAAAAALILRASPVPDASRRSISATSVLRSSKRRPKWANAASVSPACQEPMTRSPAPRDQPDGAVGVDAAEPVRIAATAAAATVGAGRRRARGRGAAVLAGERVWGWWAARPARWSSSPLPRTLRADTRAPAARRGA